MQIRRLTAAAKFACLAILLYAVGRAGGWYVARAAVVERQRAAIARLEDFGADYFYDFQLPAEHADADTSLLDRDDPDVSVHWLSRYLGTDWFHQVLYVSFSFVRLPSESASSNESEEEYAELPIESAIPTLFDLHGLRWVALGGTEIGDRSIKALASLPTLERLWLGGTAITDAGLATLQQSQSLELLAIEATPTTDRGLAFIARFPRLHLLSLGNPNYTQSGLLKLFRKKQDFTELYLDRLPVDDTVAAEIAKCKSLKTLSVRETPITNAGVKELAAARNLRTLFLDGTRITDEGLEFAGNWTQLTNLSVEHTEVGDEGLALLKGCRELEYLGIRNSNCSFAGPLKLVHELQGRTLEEAATIAFDSQLSSAGEVLDLELQDIRFGDQHVELLSDLPKLAWLEIPGCQLTDVGADRLAELGLSRLSKLRLDNTAISDRGFWSLMRLPALRDFHLRNTSVSESAISEAVDKYPSVRTYR